VSYAPITRFGESSEKTQETSAYSSPSCTDTPAPEEVNRGELLFGAICR